MDASPWDIYAKQLFFHKLGYPLWVPDPAPDKPEIDLGDVGWLDEGEFHTLFNSTKAADAPQTRGALPEDYTPFNMQQAVVSGPREKLTQPVLCSRSIHRLDMSAGLEANMPGASNVASVGTSFSFQCAEDSGALLMLHPSGISHDILSRETIKRYMRAHFDSWMELANAQYGLGLKDEELIFVSGTIKTSRWAVAAFYGDYRKKQGAVNGKLGSLAAMDFSLSISDARLDTSHYRVGPPRSRARVPSDYMIVDSSSDNLTHSNRPQEGEEKEQNDQCIFLHYYKMKRRRMMFGKGPIQAAAGPHDLPSDSEEDEPNTASYEESCSSSECIDQVPLHRKAYDPVNIVLDYILQHSDASVAIASDVELFDMFTDIPQNMSKELLRLSPDIVVDAAGVGTLSSSLERVGFPRSDSNTVGRNPVAKVEPDTSSLYLPRPHGYAGQTTIQENCHSSFPSVATLLSTASPALTTKQFPDSPSPRFHSPACGACRMRRVKCDLKDLPTTASGQHPPCSNCSERGLNCVDESAEVRAVKPLRRGRRLQKVEAVYGKATKDDADLRSAVPPRSVIPQLKPDFFRSPFFRRFHIQRAILEPTEYCTRFNEWFSGTSDCLPFSGQLIALALVVWAASYGHDEAGEEIPHLVDEDMPQRKERINEMLLELLYLVDIHGILRKPSWDGVRALLLIMPLTEEVQTPLERLTMYDATMSQVYALCNLNVDGGQGDYVDALVRARIFWYAYVNDGVTSGLRGGRIALTEEDLSAFESTLPPIGNDGGPSSSYAFAFRLATPPIRIASVCRELHAILTGPKARQREEIDENRLQDVWDQLERCGRDLDGLRQFVPHGIVQPEDVERFIDGWQIFLFESHKIIREALKQRLVALPVQETTFLPESHPTRSRNSDAIVRLHTKANVKCHAVVRYVVTILRRNLGTAFFHYDAALIRDGCFFASFLLAAESGTREDVEVCLTALSEMRWAFSKSDERQRTVRLVWGARAQPKGESSKSFSSSTLEEMMHGPGTFEESYVRRALMCPINDPPISLSVTTTETDSGYESAYAHSIACTPEGRWPSTASASGSESERYQQASSSSPFPSSSSSYAQSSRSAHSLGNVLCTNGDGAVGPCYSTSDLHYCPVSYSPMGQHEASAGHLPAPTATSQSGSPQYEVPNYY